MMYRTDVVIKDNKAYLDNDMVLFFNYYYRTNENLFERFLKEMDIDDFYSALILLIGEINKECNKVSKDLTKYPYSSYLNSLINDFRKSPYASYNFSILKFNVSNEEINNMMKMIDKIISEFIDFNTYKNLTDIMNDDLENLKTIESEQEYLKIEEKYLNIVKMINLDDFNLIHKDIKDKIINEWNKYITKTDDITPNKFNLIIKNKKDNIDNNKAYLVTNNYIPKKAEFGFILKNTGVNRVDLNNDKKIIVSPKRFIELCKLNKDNKYSLILNKIEYEAIYCFTDGTKELDNNYINTHILSLNYPNLKVYYFDLLKLRKNNELLELKINIINKLYKKIYNLDNQISLLSLYKYDYFFEQLDKLKKLNFYTEDDVEELFKLNNRFINSNDVDKIFSGKYDRNEIRNILSINNNFDIKSVLEGKITINKINNLKLLFKYKDRLNAIYPGLSNFIVIINSVELNDDIINIMNNTFNLNFNKLTSIVEKYFNINNIKQDVLSDDDQRKLLLENQYKYYYSFNLKKCEYELLKEKYIELNKVYNISIKESRILNNKINAILDELDKLNNQIELVENNKSLKKTVNKINELKLQIEDDMIHPVLLKSKIMIDNYKLKKLLIKEKKLTMQIKDDCKEYYLKQDELIDSKKNIDGKINLNNTKIEFCLEQIKSLKEKLIELFDSYNLSSISREMENANKFIDEYKEINDDKIRKISK